MKQYLYAVAAWLALYVGIFALPLQDAAPALAQGVSPNQMFGCNQSAQYAGTAGTVQLVAAAANGTARIYVCGFTVTAGVAATFQFEYGTGTNCATSPQAITPAFGLPANGSVVDDHAFYAGITPVPAGQNLCVVITGGPAPMIVYYTQF
jgi:hypothetical protein